MVRICRQARGLGNEQVPRHGAQRAEHPRVAHPAILDLGADHVGPLGGVGILGAEQTEEQEGKRQKPAADHNSRYNDERA